MSNKEFKEFQKFRDDLQQEFNVLTKREAPLSDVLTHKELYEAYPDIAKLNTMQDKSMGLEGELNPFGIKYGDVSNKNNLRGLFLHEGQHGIQTNEGWALGGSPKNYTQQAEAELAKKALLMRNEIDAMPSSIPFDERAKTVKELFEKLDQTPIDKKTMVALSEYGLPLGEAFQLRDDLLGVYGDASITGKPAGDDLREGKKTVLIALSRENQTPSQSQSFQKYFGSPELDSEGITCLQQIILDTGAKDKLEKMIEELTEKSILATSSSDFSEEGQQLLRELAHVATKRSN
jgi:hypothetical protein